MTKTVFLDLDGVLADFVAGSFRVHNRTPHPIHTWDYYTDWGLTAEQFFAPMGREFWAGLDKLPDADWLVATVRGSAHDVAIATGPCLTPGCIEGKRDWVEKHYPALAPRIVFTGAKHLLAHRGALLVDDSNQNVERFGSRGGWNYLWPQPWNRNAAETAHRRTRFSGFLGGFLQCSG